jgi:hypothetical protein
MPIVELELRAIRPPLPFRMVLGRAGLAMLLPMVFITELGVPWRVAMAVVLGLGGGLYLAYRHTRPQPAGILRLSPGKLESSAHRPAVQLACAEIRDIEVRADAILVRRWLQEPFVIHHERLEVPPAELRRALDTWYTHDPAQRKKHARTLIMRGVYGLVVGLVVGLLLVLAPLLFR